MGKELAELLFPGINKTVEGYLKMYTKRQTNAFRYAPSPTGFLHIGGLGMTYVNSMLAKKNNGILFLRIEDTDQKREVSGAVREQVEGLASFGIKFDEGFDGGKHFGNYAPYRQSERSEIYHTFAKRLVELGSAYPCFCTDVELDNMRKTQTQNKQPIGYWGDFAVCKDLTLRDVKKRLERGEQWCLRFNPEKTMHGPRVEWHDLVRGKMSLPSIINHVVIVKKEGLPPYNFAHVVDDTLMRTSHILRGEEWLSSTAEHIQIARAFALTDIGGYSYAHLPTITIMDGESKRKLSKRKDKEAAVAHFLEKGYPREAILEYLLTLYNTDFEMWRIANPGACVSEFNFRLEKIGSNSPLFDLAKLNDISRNIIAGKTKAQISKEVADYFATRKDKESKCIRENMNALHAILAVDRETPKPRKDLARFSDIYGEYEYLFRRVVVGSRDLSRDMRSLIEQIVATYSASDERDVWWNKIKELCEKHNFAGNMKDFKANPSIYKGNIGEATQALRRLLTGRENTPDLYVIMKILGKDEIRARLG